MNWDSVIHKVSPYVVAIDTPAGGGTGFLCLYSEDRRFCGIATAAHVVSHAEQWQQPIRLRHYVTNRVVLLKEEQRFIHLDYRTDSAVILFSNTQLDLPETLIPFLPIDRPLQVGVEVGWLGFPAIEPYELCFFAGIISANKVAAERISSTE